MLWPLFSFKRQQFTAGLFSLMGSFLVASICIVEDCKRLGVSLVVLVFVNILDNVTLPFLESCFMCMKISFFLYHYVSEID